MGNGSQGWNGCKKHKKRLSFKNDMEDGNFGVQIMIILSVNTWQIKAYAIGPSMDN